MTAKNHTHHTEKEAEGQIHHYNHKNDMKILIILLALLGVGWFLFLREYNSRGEVESYEVAKKTYECPDGRNITAAFSGNIVNLELSDGRSLVLNRPVNGGNKYSNADESMSFKTEGNRATVSEGDAQTYDNCQETTPVAP